MKETHVLQEMRNIARHYPVFPGDTLSHATANECVRRGWAERDENGDFVPTGKGPFHVVASVYGEEVENES